MAYEKLLASFLTKLVLNSEKWSLIEQIRRPESQMDFLKNEHCAMLVLFRDTVQPSLDQNTHKCLKKVDTIQL